MTGYSSEVSMKMHEWGEESFIQNLKDMFTSSEIIMGIGDDCAVIPAQQNRVWLVTTDALVEDVHFITAMIPPEDLGYKSIAINVSDIAAMGGIPQYAFLTISMPSDTKRAWVDRYVAGFKQACEEYNVSLLGGDTTGSKKGIFLSITFIGRAVKGRVKYRHGAQVGDVVCVTGYLGDSSAGLLALQQQLPRGVQDSEVEHLVRAHFRPRAQVHEGLWLSRCAFHDGYLRWIQSGSGTHLDRFKVPCRHRHRQIAQFPSVAKYGQKKWLGFDKIDGRGGGRVLFTGHSSR